MIARPTITTLFPYTTLFRSRADHAVPRDDRRELLLAPAFGSGGTHRQHQEARFGGRDRKSTRLNSSHLGISYAVFCLKKKILGAITRPSRGPQSVARSSRPR